MLKRQDPRLMGLGMRIAQIDSKLGRSQSDLSSLRERLKETEEGLAELRQMYQDEEGDILKRIEALQKEIEDLTVEKQNLESSLSKVLQGGPVMAYRSRRP